MSYKKNASSNRDALFGSAGASDGPKHKKEAAANRNALFGDAAGGGSSKPSSRPTASTPTSSTSASSSRPTTTNSNLGYKGGKTKIGVGSVLSPEAKAVKLKEAEDYKQKANAAMQKSFFARPDPVAASTYYKRAAECYQQVGDVRMERLYRVSSGQCNMMIKAWASAASDYTRAAELALESEDLEVNLRRQDAYNYHLQASEAWREMGEKAKAATSQVAAAVALNFGQEGTMLSKDALAGMEAAVEAFVPDVYNAYAKYRQTGHSAFIDPDSEETIANPSAETMAAAEAHLVSRSYSHEPLQELVYTLVGFGEYPSALYAAGAATALLEKDGLSTLSLSRAFATETILTLAMGDPIAAEQNFLSKHCQKTTYLSSRECKLSEDLFRAVKMRDQDALEEARSPTGSNRAALANLHPALRELVGQLRISGVARKTVGETAPLKKKKPSEKKRPSSGEKKKKPSSGEKKKGPAPSVEQEQEEEAPPPSLHELMDKKTGYEQEAEEGAVLDGAALQDELDALNFGDDEEEDLEDDDFDLR